MKKIESFLDMTERQKTYVVNFVKYLVKADSVSKDISLRKEDDEVYLLEREGQVGGFAGLMYKDRPTVSVLRINKDWIEVCDKTTGRYAESRDVNEGIYKSFSLDFFNKFLSMFE